MAILPEKVWFLIKVFIFMRLSNNTIRFSCKHNIFFFAKFEYGGADLKNDNLLYKVTFPPCKKSRDKLLYIHY